MKLLHPLDHIHFLSLIIYEEMKYRWFPVSRIKGWDLRGSGLCLPFYDSCRLCWFSEMPRQGKKLKTSSVIYCLICQSSGNEIRPFQWSEMLPACYNACIHLCTIIFFKSGAFSTQENFSCPPFLFVLSFYSDSRLTNWFIRAIPYLQH